MNGRGRQGGQGKEDDGRRATGERKGARDAHGSGRLALARGRGRDGREGRQATDGRNAGLAPYTALLPAACHARTHPGGGACRPLRAQKLRVLPSSFLHAAAYAGKGTDALHSDPALSEKTCPLESRARHPAHGCVPGPCQPCAPQTWSPRPPGPNPPQPSPALRNLNLAMQTGRVPGGRSHLSAQYSIDPGLSGGSCTRPGPEPGQTPAPSRARRLAISNLCSWSWSWSCPGPGPCSLRGRGARVGNAAPGSVSSVIGHCLIDDRNTPSGGPPGPPLAQSHLQYLAETSTQGREGMRCRELRNALVQDMLLDMQRFTSDFDGLSCASALLRFCTSGSTGAGSAGLPTVLSTNQPACGHPTSQHTPAPTATATATATTANEMKLRGAKSPPPPVHRNGAGNVFRLHLTPAPRPSVPTAHHPP
ncbi:hypothetical protein CALCODRAFT_30923 [Calocera cornea HHB12733]|uniref:Uncharacterized protein n=1 Tax=Calocera cornea HHB12733 TaxID=1353952 RepID=A0A165E2V1_9BASI|nr:hypothetical protein CALCODRAFT_30923 [Calocera cornea HHB12733]